MRKGSWSYGIQLLSAADVLQVKSTTTNIVAALPTVQHAVRNVPSMSKYDCEAKKKKNLLVFDNRLINLIVNPYGDEGKSVKTYFSRLSCM